MKGKSKLAAAVQGNRRRLGLSREQVATAMQTYGHDWTEHTVVGVENDRRRVDVYELIAMTLILEQPAEAFLPDSPRPPSAPAGRLAARARNA